ncbi:MAG: tyrosine--tRNA ligase [Nanoarchaeota archaeon]
MQQRLDLIKRNTEEILGEKELEQALSKNKDLKHYIGFEISGKPHLGHGLVCMLKVKDLMDAGIDCRIFLADWHSWINDKLGGNLDVIKEVAVNYFKEVMKAGFKCVGGDPDKLKFILGSDLYHNNDLYWLSVIDISKNISLSRILRSITIMGRKEGEAVDFAKLVYPPMQVADIFIQGIHIPHAGMDQRKAQVVARDVAMKLSFSPLLDHQGKQMKPMAIHGHLIMGLQKPPIWPVPQDKIKDLKSELKMSKSIPSSSVYMDDSIEDIKKKISKAFCPEKNIDYNPLLDWAKYLVFATGKNSILEVKREDKFGGDKIYNSYKELEKDFESGTLHPVDLKNAMVEKLVQLLEPAREHLNSPKIKDMKKNMEKLMVANRSV